MQKIETFEQLFELADSKRAVFVGKYGANAARRPAAFIVQMPAAYIRRLMQDGGLYAYKPVKQKETNQ